MTINDTADEAEGPPMTKRLEALGVPDIIKDTHEVIEGFAGRYTDSRPHFEDLRQQCWAEAVPAAIDSWEPSYRWSTHLWYRCLRAKRRWLHSLWTVPIYAYNDRESTRSMVYLSRYEHLGGDTDKDPNFVDHRSKPGEPIERAQLIDLAAAVLDDRPPALDLDTKTGAVKRRAWAAMLHRFGLDGTPATSWADAATEYDFSRQALSYHWCSWMRPHLREAALIRF